MHVLVVYVKEGLPFAQGTSPETLKIFTYVFDLLYVIHSLSYFFFLYLSLSLSLSMVFDSISFNIDEILYINPYENVFVSGDLTFIIRTGLTILVELMNLVSFFIIFLSQMTLLR